MPKSGVLYWLWKMCKCVSSQLHSNGCTVEVYGHWATFVEGSDEARTDRGTVKMSGTVYLKRGQLYVPVDDSAKMFDMAWYYAERNRILNWNTASEDKPLYKQPE